MPIKLKKQKSQKLENFSKFNKRLQRMKKDDEKNFLMFVQAIAEDAVKSVKRKLTIDVQQITSTFNKEMTFSAIVDQLDSVNTNLLWLGIFLNELIDKSIKESLGRNLQLVFNTTEDYKNFKDNILIRFESVKPEEGYDESLVIYMSSNTQSKSNGQDLLKIALLGGEYDPKDDKTKKVVMDGCLIDTSFLNRKVMPNINHEVSKSFFLDESLASDLETIITSRLDKLKKVKKGEDK